MSKWQSRWKRKHNEEKAEIINEIIAKEIVKPKKIDCRVLQEESSLKDGLRDFSHVLTYLKDVFFLPR